MSGTALVVGAAGGMGTEVTKQLVAAGYRTIGTVLNDSEAAHIRAAAPGLESIVKLDLGDADGVLAGLQQLAIPALDAVVVCAAIGPLGPVEVAPLAVLRRTLEVNTVACAAIYQACLPALRAAKGRLLFISSFSGKIGLPFLGHYTASKFALEGLADVMRREARRFGVEVILIEPGGVRTPMPEGQIASVERDKAALAPEQRERYGYLYDGFASVAKSRLDVMLHPSVVADNVMVALQANPPKARYPVGDDAKFLCEAARQTDPEIDEVIAGFGWA